MRISVGGTQASVHRSLAVASAAACATPVAAAFFLEPGQLVGAIAVVFVLLVVLLTAAFGMWGVVRSDLPFEMDDGGFVPRARPWRYLRQEKVRIPYGEVKGCSIAKTSRGWHAVLVLRDDVRIGLSEGDGVPREALEELERRVPTMVMDLTKMALRIPGEAR